MNIDTRADDQAPRYDVHDNFEFKREWSESTEMLKHSVGGWSTTHVYEIMKYMPMNVEWCIVFL